MAYKIECYGSTILSPETALTRLMGVIEGSLRFIIRSAKIAPSRNKFAAPPALYAVTRSTGAPSGFDPLVSRRN